MKLKKVYTFFLFLVISVFAYKTAFSQDIIIPQSYVFYGGDTLNDFNFKAVLDRPEVRALNLENRLICLHKMEDNFVREKYHTQTLSDISIPDEPMNTVPGKLDKPMASACNNLDFGDGNYTNWTGDIGYNANSTKALTVSVAGISTLGINSNVSSCSWHTLVTGGKDFYGGFPMLDPNGSLYSLRLGGDSANEDYNWTPCANKKTNDPNQGSMGEEIMQTFTVTATNAMFTYHYAVVLNDGAASGHTEQQQPYFRAEVLDSTGTPIPCLQYYMACTLGVPPPGFLTSKYGGNADPTSSVYYLPWTSTSFNLRPYIGSKVTIRFTAAGCTVGGHFGYAYVDCVCSETAWPIVAIKCNSAVITCPSGATSYSWSGPGIVSGGTTQSVTVNASGTYSVLVTVSAGCTYTLDTTITIPPPLAVTATSNNILCFGGTGSATSTVTGGTPAYSYSWNTTPAQTTSTATALSAGSYTVTVTDSNGCIQTEPVTITQPSSAISVTTSSTPVNCKISGTATINASGGTPAYTYNWNSGQTTSNINTGQGTYTVTVTDADGCSDTAKITVGNIGPVITPATASSKVLCNGGNTGGASVTGVTGGATPYTYSWNNGQTGTTDTALTAGTYTVTVTDNNGCTGIDTATIIQPTAITPLILSSNAACFGNNGSITTNGTTGGTPGYNYLWNTGATTSSITGPAGNYSVTITDANGCKDSIKDSITQPSLLTLKATTIPASCNGECNGQMETVSAGGTAPYTYNWSNGVSTTTASISGLCAGTYSVVIADTNGCKADTTGLIVTQPPPLTVTTGTTPAYCYQANGEACVTSAGGGTSPYTYSWNNGATTSCINNVIPATYTAIVTDAKGCPDTLKIAVPNTPGDTAVITATTDVSCFGGSNGTAMGAGKGGSPPYTYLWSNAQTTDSATGLPAGIYSVIVTDSKGCPDTAVATIAQPTQVATKPGPTQKICISDSATITASASGGTPGYTYIWSNGATGSSIVVRPIHDTTYTVVVTDSHLCPGNSAIDSVIVNPPLSISVSPDKATCPGGSVSFTASANGGDGNYLFSWAPTAGLNTATGSTVTSSPGVTTEYTVTVKDNCGTPVAQDSVKAIVDPLPQVIFKADTTNGCSPLCVKFTDTSVISSGGLASLEWTFGDGGTSKAKDTTYCYKNSGIYTVGLTVKSDSGCVNTLFVPNMITVYSHPLAAFTWSPQPVTTLQPLINFTDLSKDLYGGITNWFWQFGGPGDGTSTTENPTYTYSDTGTFCPILTVTNIHGCTDSTVHCIYVEPFCTIYIPNAFTPTGTGINNVFTAVGDYVCSFEMYIFDRWGMQIFHTTDMYQGWNGKVNNGANEAQEDTYIYVINAEDCLEHQKQQYVGRVTLIR
ncbi:MAG: PKD domain-containing protein [Bacteroidia bacterium]